MLILFENYSFCFHFQYKLSSFTESRQTAWEYEPFTGLCSGDIIIHNCTEILKLNTEQLHCSSENILTIFFINIHILLRSSGRWSSQRTCPWSMADTRSTSKNVFTKQHKSGSSPYCFSEGAFVLFPFAFKLVVCCFKTYVSRFETFGILKCTLCHAHVMSRQ